MNTFAIMFKSYTQITEFLCNYFEKNGNSYKIEEKDGNTEIIFSGYREEYEFLITTTVCHFYKHKFILQSEHFIEKKDMVYYALVGIVIGAGLKKEKEEIRESIPTGSVINLDGFCNFVLAETANAWKSIGVLVNKLYANCLDGEDKRALIEYFYSKGKEEKRVIVLDKGIYYNDNNEDIYIYNYYRDEDIDLTVNLFSLLPREIIVRSPDEYNREFIDFITELGK